MSVTYLLKLAGYFEKKLAQMGPDLLKPIISPPSDPKNLSPIPSTPAKVEPSLTYTDKVKAALKSPAKEAVESLIVDINNNIVKVKFIPGKRSPEVISAIRDAATSVKDVNALVPREGVNTNPWKIVELK